MHLYAFKLNFVINIPYSVDETNANDKLKDGKTLSWNIKPAFVNGKDIHLKTKFKIYHENIIIGLVVFGVILIIVAIIFLVLGFVKKDIPKQRKIFMTIAIIIFAVTTAFASYAKYVVDNPPQLTEDDKITIEQIKSLDVKSSTSTNTNKKNVKVDSNSLNLAKNDLKNKNIDCTVSAVSVKNEAGFLALINMNSKQFFAVFDARDDIVALISCDNQILNFRENAKNYSDGKKYYSPLIFNMEIMNDSKNGQDSDLGEWYDTKHVLPVYALFDVNDKNKVVPGMLTSGKGVKPSHYQAPLKEQRNVNLANIVLTHLDGLKKDIEERNIKLPN